MSFKFLLFLSINDFSLFISLAEEHRFSPVLSIIVSYLFSLSCQYVLKKTIIIFQFYLPAIKFLVCQPTMQVSYTCSFVIIYITGHLFSSDYVICSLLGIQGPRCFWCRLWSSLSSSRHKKRGLLSWFLLNLFLIQELVI